MYKFRLFIITISLFSSLFASAVTVRRPAHHRKVVKILSVDGGGVRGVIPTLILSAIEERLEKKNSIHHCFDIMAGTSTGALIVLALNVKDEKGLPKYYLTDIMDLYETLSNQVFARSWAKWFTSLGGWRTAKYDSEVLEGFLARFFLDAKLSETFKKVLVPAFNLTSHKMHFFRTTQARLFPLKDYFLKDIARATSAAPTYFEAAHLYNHRQTYNAYFIDGGVGINNPTISAIVHAIELYGRNSIFFVLSIGTGSSKFSFEDNVKVLKMPIKSMGKIDWAPQIVNVLMDSVSDVTHYQASVGLPPRYYYRLQVHLPADLMQMDNGDPENLAHIKKYVEKFIIKNNKVLDKIATMLDRDDQSQLDSIQSRFKETVLSEVEAANSQSTS